MFRRSLPILPLVCCCLLTGWPARAADDESAPEIVVDPNGFSGLIWGLDFAPSRQGPSRMLAVAAETSVRIYDPATRKEIVQLRQGFSRGAEGGCRAVRFSPDGEWLAISVFSHDKVGLRIYRVGTWEQAVVAEPDSGNNLWRLEFSPDGQHLCAANIDGELTCWRWNPLAEPKLSQKKVVRINEAGTRLLAVHALSNDRLAVVNEKREARCFSIPDLREVALPESLQNWKQFIDSQKVPWLNFRLQLNRGLWVSTLDLGGRRYSLNLWRQGQGNQFGAGKGYSGHGSNPMRQAIDPNTLLVASGDATGEVHLWDGRTGALQGVIRPDTTPIIRVGFAPELDDPSRIVFMRQINGKTEVRSFSVQRKMLEPFPTEKFPVPPAAALKIEVATTRATTGVPQQLVSARNQDGQQIGSYQLTQGFLTTATTLAPLNRLGCRQAALVGTEGGLLVAWDTQTLDPLHPKRFFAGLGGTISSLAVSTDGQYLLGGNLNGDLSLWSLTDYDPQKNGDLPFRLRDGLVLHAEKSAPVKVGDRILQVDGKPLTKFDEDRLYKRVTYAPGKQIEVAGERDGKPFTVTVALIAGADFAEPLLKLLVTDANQWILWTPRGYYDSSRGADKLIGFLKNNGPTRPAEYFPIERFQRTMYQPELLDLIWKLRDVDEALARFNLKTGQNLPPFPRSDLDLDAFPRIVITSHQNNDRIDAETVTLEGVLEGNLQGIKLFLSIPAWQEIPVDPISGRFRVADNRLNFGTNFFSLFVKNQHEHASTGTSLVLEGTRQSGSKPDLYVLTVGIANFKSGDPFGSLKDVEDGSQRFGDFAQKQQDEGLYGDVRVISLNNEQATREGLEAKFQELEEVAGNARSGTACFMLYFCTHGAEENGKYYLVAHDTDKRNLAGTAITEERLTKLLNTLKEGHETTLFLDTCESGRMGKTLREATSDSSGVLYFTSCEEGHKGWSHPKEPCSMFLFALLKVCQENKFDLNPTDAYYAAGELEYGIGAEVNNVRAERQTPQSNADAWGKRRVFKLLQQ